MRQTDNLYSFVVRIAFFVLPQYNKGMNFSKKAMTQNIKSIIGIAIFIAAMIVAIVMLSYLFIIIIGISFIIFIFTYVKNRWFSKRHQSHPKREKLHSKRGRTIDQ